MKLFPHAFFMVLTLSVVAQAEVPQLTKLERNGTQITVTYLDPFPTCVHLLKASDKSIQHEQNWFCTQNRLETQVHPLNDFKPLVAGTQYVLCHGNNYNLCSAALALTEVTPPPAISSLKDTNDTTISYFGSGRTIRINGTGLSGATSVRFGNEPAASFTVVSPSRIDAVTPLRLSNGQVTVTTPKGTASSLAYVAFRISNLAPAQSFTGTSFILTTTPVTSPTVKLNGATASTLALNASQLQVLVPASVGPGAQTVELKSGLNVAQNWAFPLTFLPPPIITTFSPSAALPGATVTVNGSNFLPSSKVYFNNGVAAVTTFRSATSLTAVVPAGATTGVIQVRHPSISGTNGTKSSTAVFTVIAPPAISSLSAPNQPNLVYFGSGRTININGSGFIGTTSVKFAGEAAAPFTVVSDSLIQAVTPLRLVSGQVEVTNPAGTVTGGTYTAFAITGLAPSTIYSGTSVILSNTPATSPSVKVNGQAFQSTVVNASQIQVSIPNTVAAGSLSFQLSDSANSAHNWRFPVTVLPPPTLTSFTPATGSVGATVTVNGTNFRPNSVIFFASGVQAQTTFVSSTRLTAIVPAGTVTGTITVRHPTIPGTNGTRTSAATFTLAAAPTITSFSPAQEAPGAVVTVTGTNLTGVNVVKFSGVQATGVTVVNATTLRATVPPLATSGKIRVESPAGAVDSAATFVVNPLCNPTIDTARELGIKHLSVVENSRTVFNPANPALSPWSFGFLMGRMAGVLPNDPAFQSKTSTFVKGWLQQFQATTAPNGATALPRPQIAQLFAPWPKLGSTSTLDFTKAPFRLLAIMNRLDLRNPAQAGEGRFVFGVLSEGFPISAVVILEYRLPLTATMTQNAWALKWHELSNFPVGSTGYLAKLEEITKLFSADAYPGLINGSPINQVRTNELSSNLPWELREMRLNQAGQLVLDTVKQTPRLELDNSAELKNWVLANQDPILDGTYVVPAKFPGTNTPFLDASAETPGNTRWLSGVTGVPEDVRHEFSLNTCNGCHAAETNTGFLHVTNRLARDETFFSKFLEDDLVNRATGPNGMRNLIIDANCQ